MEGGASNINATGDSHYPAEWTPNSINQIQIKEKS